MWWYDPSKNVPFSEKVVAAAQRYQRRTGRIANVCYVNPAEPRPDVSEVNGIRVVTNANVHLSCFYAGENETTKGG